MRNYGTNRVVLNIIQSRTAIVNRQEKEIADSWHNFWRDAGVANNIPRQIFNMKYGEYFSATERKHKEELAIFDKQNMEGTADGGIYTESGADENFAGAVYHKKLQKYLAMSDEHKQQRAIALSDFFEKIPETHRQTIKDMYRMTVEDLETAQDEQIKDAREMLFGNHSEAEYAEDVPMAVFNPIKLNQQDTALPMRHELNEHETVYANSLISSFAANNKAVIGD